MASANSQQLALHLLSAVKEQLHAGLTHEAVLNLCRAYALEPLLSTHHLVTSVPSHIVRTVVSTLEDWCACACGLGLDDVLKRYHIPLTWEQVCDIILSPELAPRSHFAWTMKIKYQMQEKRYAHVVITCTKALKTFAGGQGERHAFWVQRGLAYLLLKESRNAVKDYLSAFQENPSACQTYVTKFQKGYVGSILNAFYNTLSTMDTETERRKPEDAPAFTKHYQFILAFEKNPGAYGECASHMMKQRKFKEAIKLLSAAIRHFTVNNPSPDYLQLLFSRADCYLVLDEVDMALGDYMAAASLGEEHTRLTLLSLPLHQQGTLVARAKRVASDTLVQYRTNNASKTSSADTRKTKLDQAASLFQLLYLMDEQYVDAFYRAAECHKLLHQFTEAIQLFNRFLSLRPRSSGAHYDRALCYLECGDTQSALSDYNTSLDLQPTFVQAWCGRALLWLRRGEPGKAITDFAAASSISTELIARWVQELTGKEQADLRAKLKDYLTCTLEAPRSTSFGEEAVGIGDVLTRVWPKDVSCHLLYADMLVALKKTDEAQAVLVRLLQNTPDDLTATIHLAALRMMQGSRVASALEDLVTATKTHGEGKLQTALLSVKEEQRTQIMREAHDQGVKRVNANPDDPDAETLFTVAVTAAPRHAWESYFWRAKVRWRLRNPGAALADCTSALAIKEDSAEVLCWRALISLRSNIVKAAYLDFLRALLLDPDALKSFVMSRREGEEKSRLLAALEDCAQRLFYGYMRSGTKLKCILQLCRLLVHLESTSWLYHSNLADALIISGDYHRAAEELNEAERYSPENVSVLSRSSLVHMKIGNVNLCVLKLSHIAHLNPKSLEFTFKIFNEAQKRTLVSESVSHARLPSCDDNRALLNYTVAVFASDGQNPQVLRVRSQCLERMRCYEPAIGDLSAVITMGPCRIEDLCARANLHFLNTNPKAACGDFIAAMEMNEVVAKDFIYRCPAGKDVVCQEFVKVAKSEIRARSFTEGMKVCSYGLKIDPTNAELTQLKMQLEYSARKCIIQ